MTESYIRFKKQRDLGEIISDTFRFLRENFKPLFKLIFRIAGPAFLVLLFALTYYSYLSLDTVGNSFLGVAEGMNFGMLLISGFILLSSLLGFYVLLYGTVLHYINSYVNHNGNAIEQEVYQGVKQDFGSLLGLLLLSGIVLVFGFMLCILPGIYLWVPVSIVPVVMVFRRNSVSDAINDVFSLIKDNWWTTFLTLLVMAILVYVISLIFQFPLFIYYFVKAFTMAEEGSLADPTSLFDWVYVVFNVLSSLVQYLLTTILIIAAAFIYFDLNEKKNLTGTYETISNLGSEIR